jgi:hypothetical protein
VVLLMGTTITDLSCLALHVDGSGVARLAVPSMLLCSSSFSCNILMSALSCRIGSSLESDFLALFIGGSLVDMVAVRTVVTCG